MSRAGRRPSELVTVTARAASLGGPAVAFAVVHWAGGRALSVVGQEAVGEDWYDGDRDVLAFDLPIGGFRVFATAADAPTSTRAGVGEVDAGSSANGYTYLGIASLNPRFLYDSARDHEVLISRGGRPWAPDLGDALLFGRVMAGLATAAAGRAAAPIMLMQSPAAPYPTPPPGHPSSAHADWPTISRGAAIRLSVGMSGDDGPDRLAVMEEVARISTEFGLRLHVSDRRTARVRGEWWPVNEYDETRYQEVKAEIHPGRVPVAHRALLLTFVGPARIGSSADILRALADRRIGVLAVTISALQELAFVNVVVPIREGPEQGPLDGGQVVPAADGIEMLAEWCALRPRPFGPSMPLGRASDYQLCMTGPVDARGPVEQDRPLWLTWQKPVGEDVPSQELVNDVLARVVADPQVESAQLEYFRSRVIGDGRRMSAKVSVRLSADIPESALGTVLSRLARSTQADVEWALSGQDPAARSTRLIVAWRERWLGRTSSSGVS